MDDDKGQIWWFVRDATGPAAKETYREVMEKFRPEMRKFHLNKPVQFR